MQPPEYTLDHAAEILGMRVDELLAAAECGKITLVHVIHRDTHAPGVQLSEGSAETYKVFIRNFAGDDGKMEQEFLPDTRLKIVIDPDRIHKIRAGDRVRKTSGRIYGNEEGFVWHGMIDVTPERLRVPVEELEHIRREASEKRDSLPSPASKRKQPPRKETIAKVVDRGKTLVQNGLMPEFETVWSSIKVMAPTGTQYRAESNLIETPEGETLTEANARRAYEKHRGNPR